MIRQYVTFVTIIYIFIISTVLLVIPGNHVNATGDAYDKSQYSINRSVQYSFTLQNKTNRVMEKAEFWTYAPVKQTATQRTVKLDVSQPYELIMNDYGNQILYFKFMNLPPFATRIITIRASLELSDIPNHVTINDLRNYLIPEKYIESDNPELSRFAIRLYRRICG